MKIKSCIIAFLCLVLPVLYSGAQSSRDSASRDSMSRDSAGPANAVSADFSPVQTEANLPLRRIALLSSGVAYFEHSGPVGSGGSPVEISFPFDAGAVNDALKSLVINDPASAAPSVRYAAENTLGRTLKSLKIDLSGDPGIGEILGGLKGAELEVAAPSPIRGRIIGVEYRQTGISFNGGSADEAWLSLFTPQGIRVIAIKDIASFRFTDEKINGDLNRALDLLMNSRDTNSRDLIVSLNGSGSRDASVSYVIPAPVWKVSYRLDLSNSPFLQGWAIVDNDSDMDWKDVQLSLITGRPVSFTQNLYPPYRVSRPVLPLAIAGIAESRTYDSGYSGAGSFAYDSANSMAMEKSMAMADEQYAPSPMMRSASPPPAAAGPSVAGGVMETASGSSAGDQFEFTLKNPVSLDRRQSAMLPLVEASVKAEKTLVFSGSRALGGGTINPGISAELTNTSGMKLPAGPITVYDGGAYAGDALIDFFPENEKRLITYGEDLSVSGNVSSKGARYVTAVNVSGGVMTISRRQTYERLYTIRNASDESKKIIIEHPITSGSDLAEPPSAEDRTASLYRFTRNLGAKETLAFTVREETPISDRVVLAQLRPETFLSYSTNQEIPANVRAALSAAIDLKKKADAAALAQANLENQRTRAVSEQERIRLNLEAAGNQSPQGQDYLRRLAAMDNDIDSLNTQIDAAAKETDRTLQEYVNYLANMSI